MRSLVSSDGYRAITTLLCAVVVLCAGCAAPPGVLFEPPIQVLTWPAPPDPPRIRFAGQLVSAADPVTGLAATDGAMDFLFGKKKTPGMRTPKAVCTSGTRVFVADADLKGVHVFDTDRDDYEFWRPPEDSASLQMPVSLCMTPDNRLLVADSGDGAVFVFDDRGEFLGTIGDGLLQRPVGVCVDPADGRIFVADAAAHLVVVLAPDGEEIRRIGGRGTLPGQFNFPTYTAIDAAGQLYVSDSLNFRVQVFSRSLDPVMTIGSKGDMPGYFAQPKGLAVDPDGRLYVADAHFEAIQVFDDSGRLLMSFGREGRAAGEFWLPTDVHIDAKGRIWIADSYNRRVQLFEYIGLENGRAASEPDDARTSS